MRRGSQHSIMIETHSPDQKRRAIVKQHEYETQKLKEQEQDEGSKGCKKNPELEKRRRKE